MASEPPCRDSSEQEARNVALPDPGNVFVNVRVTVTAGLAKEVEDVNQYAPVT
jgi:hypothetical protein